MITRLGDQDWRSINLVSVPDNPAYDVASPRTPGQYLLFSSSVRSPRLLPYFICLRTRRTAPSLPPYFGRRNHQERPHRPSPCQNSPPCTLREDFSDEISALLAGFQVLLRCSRHCTRQYDWPNFPRTPSWVLLFVCVTQSNTQSRYSLSSPSAVFLLVSSRCYCHRLSFKGPQP